MRFIGTRRSYVFQNFIDNCYLRCVEIFGTFVFFAALLILVALISHCPEDASLNTAIDGKISNFLSFPGSCFSDLLFQFLGSCSYVVALLLFSFGYQLIKYHVVLFYRVICGIFAIFLGCALIEATGVNFFTSGICGNFLLNYLNDRLLNKVALLSDPHWHFAIPLGIGILFVVNLLLALRFHFSSLKALFSAVCDLWQSYFPAKNSEGTDGCMTEQDLKIIMGQNEEDSSKLTKTFSKPFKSKPQDGVKKYVAGAGFSLPSLNLLKEAPPSKEKLSDADLLARSNTLIQVLHDFGIEGEIVGISPGPVVTLYELKPAAGVKSSRVIGLASDIARYMSAISARVSTIPGKNALGIELPNTKRQTVYLREIFESDVYKKSNMALAISLGKDIAGEPTVADLARMPHLLIAGTTGSGKSVGINAMILSLLYKHSPDECKFIMVDPKMLELSVYDDIPHLLTPVVTDPKKAVSALKWAVREMESRYVSMSKLGVRNIEGYNSKLNAMKKSGETLSRRVHTGFDPETGAPIYETQTFEMEPIPYIVIIVDEMADLMLVAGKEIEIAVQRLAQMARAAGIHLIMATQRPSVDVITGTIKANFPTRVSFQVSSKIDSRTILGEQGAEQLLGQGDMLYMGSGGRTTRIHCPFVSDLEVEKVTEYLKAQGEPHYITDILEDEEEASSSDDSGEISGDDPMYKEAVSLILREGKASTSFLQRHLKIGYNRAARIIDMMEKAGIVSPANHVGKREILGR